MNSIGPLTKGTHHIGLTVSNLEASAKFFIEVLDWSEVKRVPEYPAVFVTDGVLMITLWGVKSDKPQAFDKNSNIGLHHLALRVETFSNLNIVYEKVVEYGLKVEFSPELLGEGPAKHMMFYEPSGVRLEMICIPS